MLKNIFPSLFNETSAISAVFIGASVAKSHVNNNCVIIRAVNGKPVQWLIDYMIAKNLDTSRIDDYDVKYNTDGTISVFDKVN
jgi:hypothetical protein